MTVPDLKLLATAHRLLYDAIGILGKEETASEPFEIGCKCKTPEFQEQLFDVMTAVFRNTTEIKVCKKSEDFILCIIRMVEKKEAEEEKKENDHDHDHDRDRVGVLE